MATPYEKRRQRKLFLTLVLPAFAGAVALSLVAISQTQVYAYAPSTMPTRQELGTREVRLAGLVAEGSLRTGADNQVAFIVTDGVADVPVTFTGILPSLVAENEGVIAQGKLGSDGVFTADTVLARHDENYEAPEVMKALEEAAEKQAEY
ncbi:cytochrome c maturation protein CcmE [Parvularcula lutaonensis]|uniref:Cytochrome c-type biogenesis protein CcmE n=1 Tax=Parvularcula lutaonensis TaxID=491923 RepID=A0ABV7MEA5_9PROT|nr:cytochrome c maturation protein CcmE [Parvularcula lutaonensis]GGY54968.1 cytochrome c-type biogenesis protein CcmE [Parvularcula lutaonensis]